MLLVLMPGLDGTGLLFKPLLDLLPATIKPIVIAYPGDRSLNYDELLPIVLDALPRDEMFILLGESFSGPLAVMVAATKPPGLIGLVLCATFIQAPWPYAQPAIYLLARALPFQLFLPFKRLRAWLGEYATAEYRALVSEMSKRLRPAVIAFRVRQVFDVDVTDALRSCELPILYLRGTRDLLVPARNLRLIQQIRPGVEVATIESSHMILQRHPKRSVETIRQFAATLGAGG